MSVQLFTKSILSLLCVLAFAATTTAQNIIWEDDFSDEDAFYNEWTTGGTNGGNEDWVWLNDPGFINFGSQPDYGSTTASNGYIMFNSDANGENSHDVTVTSSAIDCSAYGQVYLTAENQYAFFSAATFSIAEVGVSTDGGNSFIYYQIHTDVEQNDLTSAVNPVNIELPEAANQAEVYIQFRWQGFYEYTWKIDDVKLVDSDPRPDHDMRVNQFHAIAPNSAVPASQVSTFGFMADIQNMGAMEQLNATLSIDINDGNTDVFTEELTYAMVGPDSVAENVFFQNEFIPVAEAGTVYTGTYTLSLEGNDDANPVDNTQDFIFAVTDTLFAKENGTGLYATQPADDNDYRFGNIFYVANGSDMDGEQLYARYVSFYLGNADDLAGSSVTTYLYEWNGEGGEDFELTEGEYVGPIAFNFYNINGSENGLTTIPVGLDGDFIQLKDDTYYIIVVEFAPGDEDTDNFMVVTSDVDYQAMNFYQDSVMNADKWAVALDVGNTGDYSLVGFGLDVVPVVRLSIGVEEVVNSVDLLSANTINVYPTVANEQVWAEINLDNPTENLRIDMFSNDGQLIQSTSLENVRQEKLKFDLNNLPTGSYYLRLQTDEGIRSKPFMIQR